MMNLAPLHAASSRILTAQRLLRDLEDDLDEAILTCILEKCVQLSRRYPKRRIMVREGMGTFSVEIETRWPGMRESEHALEAVVSTFDGKFELSYEGPRGSEADREAVFDGMFELWDMMPADLDYVPFPVTKARTYLNGKEIES